MKKLIAVLIFFLLIARSNAEIKFPGDLFMPGWLKSGNMLAFNKNDLYGYINGGAELFLEFGFIKLVVQHYQQAEQEISIEAYAMECPEAALGIYLQKCGKESPIEDVLARNSGNRYQIIAVKNSYFLIVNNYECDNDVLPAMIQLMNQTLATISQGEPISLFNKLPEENRIADSEFIFRGPFALQPIFTFGKDDIFQLNGKLFGVAADYKSEQQNRYTKMIILYPNQDTAANVLNYIKSNLDPYLEMQDQWNSGLVFKDFQNKYGLILLTGSTIEINIHLLNLPAEYK